jgi:hypothetical protein
MSKVYIVFNNDAPLSASLNETFTEREIARLKADKHPDSRNYYHGHAVRLLESAARGFKTCSMIVVRSEHDRRCEVCGTGSATLYLLTVGPQQTRICPHCKACLRSDIDRVDGDGDGY